MTVDVKLFDDLDAVERDAGGALDRASQPCLFDRLSWYRLLADHDSQGALRVARARNGIAAAWLFFAERNKALHGLTNWYSLRYDSIHSGSQDIKSNLLYEIAKNLKSVSRIEAGPVAQASALPEAFRAAGWLVELQPATVCWQVELGGRDFEAYWRDRPSQLRNTAKRRAKTADLDISIHSTFGEADWADYEAVYRASWKPHEGAPAMLKALAQAEGAVGTLRLGLAYKHGRPIAAQLWLVENGEATIHKLAYAEDAKALSPGTVLSVAMFRHAIDADQVRRIDFGTGDDAYKRDWMEEYVPLYRMTAYNPDRLAGLAGAARAGASALVRRLRSG